MFVKNSMVVLSQFDTNSLATPRLGRRTHVTTDAGPAVLFVRHLTTGLIRARSINSTQNSVVGLP